MKPREFNQTKAIIIYQALPSFVKFVVLTSSITKNFDNTFWKGTPNLLVVRTVQLRLQTEVTFENIKLNIARYFMSAQFVKSRLNTARMYPGTSLFILKLICN